jgi:hypothetical protein
MFGRAGAHPYRPFLVEERLRKGRVVIQGLGDELMMSCLYALEAVSRTTSPEGAGLTCMK